VATGVVQQETITVTVPDDLPGQLRVLESAGFGPIAEGQKLVVFDDRLAAAELELATQEAAVAELEIALFKTLKSETSDDVSTANKKKKSAQAAYNSAKAQANSAAAQVTSLQAAIKQLEASQKKYQKILDTTPNTAACKAIRQKAKDQIAKIKKSLKAKRASLATAQAAANTYAAKASAAKNKVNKYANSAADAKAEAKALSKDIKAAQTAQANAAESLAVSSNVSGYTILAPQSGAVIEIASFGQVLTAGDVVAVIRTDAPAKIVAGASANVVRVLCVGDKVSVEGSPGVITAVSTESFTVQAEQPMQAGRLVNIELYADGTCHG
jgi:uncharacterized protein (DUF3084 family)